MSDNNMYNILGIFKGLTGSADKSQLNESVEQDTVYEEVEARGSINEAVKSLESKFATFKEAKDKPDFLDVDKDGDKEEPMKKAAKDKNNAKGAMKDMFGGNAKDLTSKLKIKEGAGPYTLDDPKHPKFKANYEKYKKAHPDCKLADFVAAMRKKEKGLSEDIDDLEDLDDYQFAEPDSKDLTDLDAYQFAEPDSDTVIKPTSAKQDAAERRRRLQDLEDRRAEKDDWFDGDDTPRAITKHRAKYQDEPELDEGVIDTVKGAVRGVKRGNEAHNKGWGKFGQAVGAALRGDEEGARKAGRDSNRYRNIGLGAKGKTSGGFPKSTKVDEVAPPGAKAERMVKHIKKGYADDGKLTKREKGIAYATAWKAKKAGSLDEGTEFGDTIKNSAATMKKSKPAKLKESRVMEETDYFYEKVAKSLCGKNPNLDTADSEFEMAVRKEMVAQGMDPNRARNILLMDEDFLGDVATAYGHYCEELAETGGAPENSFLGGVEETFIDPHEKDIPSPTSKNPVTSELDEIAALAGLTKTNVYNEVNFEEAEDTMDEAALTTESSGVLVNGKEVNVNSIEVDGVDMTDSPDFADAYITYAEFADGTPLSEPELDALTVEHSDVVNMAAHGSLQDRADFLDEDDVAEGNEFSGALAAAKAAGAKEFEVDGKKYTVKEDINVNITASGEQDALNLFRKLAGMPEVTRVDTLAGDEAIEEERDIEYTNTPDEVVAPLASAIPSGDDLHKSKKAYAKAENGDNPMAVKEDALWNAYSSMIDELKG